MAIIQTVKDGQLVDASASGTSDSLRAGASDNNNGLDKEAFLQLLVAQMKYQDPLSPTDNTEYVAQLATFSQLEATTNLGKSVEKDFADGLIGKQVIVKYTSKTTGNTEWQSGTVDYVLYENGETYVAVKDGIYALSDIDSVYDQDYYDAVTLADTFKYAVAKLPSKLLLTKDDEDAVKAARAIYDNMTDYQKSFVDKDALAALEALEEQLKKITGGGSDDTGGKDETDGDGESDKKS